MVTRAIDHPKLSKSVLLQPGCGVNQGAAGNFVKNQWNDGMKERARGATRPGMHPADSTFPF